MIMIMMMKRDLMLMLKTTMPFQDAASPVNTFTVTTHVLFLFCISAFEPAQTDKAGAFMQMDVHALIQWMYTHFPRKIFSKRLASRLYPSPLTTLPAPT